MDPQGWSLVITAIFGGAALLITAIVTTGLQIATFIRAGHTAKLAVETAALMADVKKNTDGMASAAAATADAAAKASADARDKDRDTLERTTTALVVAVRPIEAPVAPAAPVTPGPVLSTAADAKPARMISTAPKSAAPKRLKKRRKAARR